MKKRFNLYQNHKKRILHLVIAGLSVITLASASGSQIAQNVVPRVHAKTRANAYDISQWQGYITNRQAKHLKREVSFVILRVQYGQLSDATFNHNIDLMQKYHIPYGVYSFSLYKTNHQAKKEAKSLVKRAPNARFYVNDCEVNRAKGRLNSASRKWSKEIHRLSNRPAILYTYYGFMPYVNQKTRHSYNGIWLATYTKRKPKTTYKYDLWQFSDNHYSRALRKRLDASSITDKKDLSSWIGQPNKQSHKSKVVKPIRKESPLSATKTTSNSNNSNINQLSND